MPYIPSTIIVSFNDFATSFDIKEFLESHSLKGVEISSTMKRYAIDVPVGREEHFAKLFRESELVRLVCSKVIQGYKPKPREENDGRRERHQTSPYRPQGSQYASRERGRAGKSR